MVRNEKKNSSTLRKGAGGSHWKLIPQSSERIHRPAFTVIESRLGKSCATVERESLKTQHILLKQKAVKSPKGEGGGEGFKKKELNIRHHQRR